MRTLDDYDINLESIKAKIYHYQRNKVKCYITVTFIKGKHHEPLLNRVGIKNIEQIIGLLQYEKPERIQIELFKNDETKSFDLQNYFYLDKALIPESKQQFQGLGEVEINNLVDQRFQKRQQEEEFEQLRVQVTELTKELGEQTELVEELETENEQLRTELESKRQIRYYAGMLGDILEGIGISKDKIRSPIAHLMGVTETAESTKEDETETKVEEPEIKPKSQQSKRREIITLICDYLESTDNQTLAKVFTVFSEIEHNPPLANDLITFIESKKEEL